MGSFDGIARRAIDITAKALKIADGYSDHGTFSKLRVSANYAEIRKIVRSLLDKEWKNNRWKCLEEAEKLLDNALEEEGIAQYIYAAEVALWFDRRFTYLTTDDDTLIHLDSLYTTEIADYSLVDHLNSEESVQETRIIIFPKYRFIPVISESSGQKSIEFSKDSKDEKPRVRRTFNRDSLHFLNNELNNVGYIPLNRREAVIHNIIVHKDKYDFSSGKIQDGLRIAFAPMLSASEWPFIPVHVTIEEEGGSLKGFRIEEIKEPEKLKKRFEEDLLLASEKNVDIVFFPEMIGTEAMIERKYGVSSNINNVGNRTKSGSNLPFITITPTIWANRTNYAVIIDRNGRILGEQKKLYPFIDVGHPPNLDTSEIKTSSSEKEETNECFGIEDIVIPDIPEITIIHIPDYARIAIMICAQFLQQQEMDSCIDIVCKYLNVSMIIVPSFSAGETDFERIIKSVEQYGASVVWGNCCGAINSKSRVIGGASFAGTDGFFRFGTKCKCSVNKEGEKRTVCNIDDACIFSVDIPGHLTRKKPEGVTIPDPIEHHFKRQEEREEQNEK